MPAPDNYIRVMSPAKINIGLCIEGRRSDGYHDLRTVFQTVDLCDTLTFTSAPREELSLSVEGSDTLSGGEDNLVMKSARMLAQSRRCTQGARITLKKNIPMGAGLGGGSSNAAAALVGLVRLWGLDVSPDNLHGMASALGSDVPFFLTGGTALGTGRGEELTPIIPIPEWGIVLATTTIEVSTPAAYSMLNKDLTDSTARFTMMQSALADENLAGVSRHLVNDLEGGVLRLKPELAGLRSLLRARVAAQGMEPVGVSMSGSGSAYYLLFSSPGDAAEFSQVSEGIEEPSLGTGLSVELRAVRPLTAGVRIQTPDS